MDMPGWVDGGCLLNSDFSVPSHASINCPLAQTELASRATRAVTSVLTHDVSPLFARALRPPGLTDACISLLYALN